jgi:hypothetical protein
MHPSVKVWWSKYQVATVHILKVYRGNRGTGPLVLNFSSQWRWVSTFMMLPLYVWGKYPSTLWIGDLVGLRASLDVLAKRDELHEFVKLRWLFFNHITVATKWAWYEHPQDGCNFAASALMLDLFKNFSRWKLCWLKIFCLLRLKLSR